MPTRCDNSCEPARPPIRGGGSGLIARASRLLGACLLGLLSLAQAAEPVDVAPWGQPLGDGSVGLMWEDPREIHEVVAKFRSPIAATNQLKLEYWGSRWPEQRLPKNSEPGGGSVGWMELGNWFENGWRVADAESKTEGNKVTFTFRPVNAKEFPGLTNYPAAFRYTLKVRISGSAPLPMVESLQAFTDSAWAEQGVRIAWQKPPATRPTLEAFNGIVDGLDSISPRAWKARLKIAANTDPNTFDRTLITVRWAREAFTFAAGDLAQGPIIVPHLGVVVLPADDDRDYDAVARELKNRGESSLYDRVASMPEQTWKSAWAGMPAKKRPIYFPLGLDGGRQRFRLDPDGGIALRSNDGFLKARPGIDTPRLALEKDPVHFTFGLPDRPVDRTLADGALPICQSTWDKDGLKVEQTAFVTLLEGMRGEGPPPPGDALTVFMARFVFTNPGTSPRPLAFPLGYAGSPEGLQLGTNGMIMLKEAVRAHVTGWTAAPTNQPGGLLWSSTLGPGEKLVVITKIPYVVLPEPAEREALARLDFDRELAAATQWWTRRLDRGSKLTTPEVMLNEFYRSHAMHLLVNCEREPGSSRRFARVGSFSYGAYGNESCMMVVDLDRRGYHAEARACLDGWLHYQGTVKLPGDFASQEGILYGAGGYESGGYNQHHGWILWCMAEHFRFTHDTNWLQSAAEGILKGADWIIRERSRTFNRKDLAAGLLPAGRLEDIGDWWFWLSTSCYTWRGLESAGWALEQIQHPEANRVKREAVAYHDVLVKAFREASLRSPVVRLRDGTSVPKIPSHPHRRGRSFGWICETLEGSIHLLITKAIDPHSPEAGWIVRDYEDNLFLSNQWGYTLDDFDKHWFGRGGMSMQACLLLDVEPYLYRDDVKNALRSTFNSIAVSYFPDVRMNTEHALPNMGDWTGDQFKSSDEANAAGWLRQLFLREEGDELLVGQAVPREWLKPGESCSLEKAATWFGPATVRYEGGTDQIQAVFEGASRNSPKAIKVRFREPGERPIITATVNGKRWTQFRGEWVTLPGTVGKAEIVVRYE